MKLLLLLTALVFTNCRTTTNCSTMYKLQPSAYFLGNQTEACNLLASLQRYSLLPAPVSIADMKNALDQGQVQPFDSLAFDKHLAQLFALRIDESQLTAEEMNILITIHNHLNPSPILTCCGGSDYPAPIPIQNPPATPSMDIDISLVPRVGVPPVTNEYTIFLSFKKTFNCNIHDIELTNILGSDSPTPTTVVLNDIGCVNGQRTFSYAYIAFATPPAAPNSFFGDVNFRDSTGATIIDPTGNPVTTTFEWSF